LDGILARLLDDGFLEPVVEGMFKSPTDIYHEAEKEALRNDASGSKGAKATAMLKLTVAETLRRRREQRSWNGGTIKRTMNGTYTNGEKRRKLMNGKAATGEKVVFDEDIQLDRNLVVRLNYEKCTVALRTQSLAGLVATDIGDVTSQVYTEALRILEAKTPRCRPDPIIDGQPQDGDEDAGPTITVSTVAGSLSSNVNVSKGIGHVSSEKPDVETLANGNGKRRREEEDDEDDSEDDIVAANGRRSRVSFDSAAKGVSAEGRQARLSHLKDHLLLLSGHSQGLLKKISNDGLGEFVVPYGRVVSYLKEKELDTYIAAAFGKEGLRLSHVLRKFGKLDEKQIQKIALMKQGEVRKVLLRMQMHGFADIQEVPKDASRAPGRTVFLWWFDMDRVIKLMLEILYKTLCRCLEVLEVSRYEARDALALAGRDDVKGNEDEMLPENYLREFRAFQMKEEQLVIQMTRLDELVAIFRDY
jgi:DNA-directed RNA polymerase III subunit RPC3